MSTNHTLKKGWGYGGNSLYAYTITTPVAVEANVGEALFTNTYNQPYVWSVNPANVVSLFMGADQNLTLSTNGTNQVKTVTPPGSSTFTLTFNAQTTAAINWNATTAQVQAAVALLSSVPTTWLKVNGVFVLTCNIQITGPNGGPWSATFVGQLGNAAQTLTSAGATITNATTGVAPTQTFSLLATAPYDWSVGSLAALVVTTTATQLSITNASGGSANPVIRAGLSQ